MTDHKVMQRALNALENLIEYDFHGKPLTDSSVPVAMAIAALREALANPKPEPVAWIDKFGNVFPLAAMRGPAWDREPWKPLYLAPPAPEYKETLK